MTVDRDRPEATVPHGVRGALLVLRFLTELALLAVLAAAGAGLGDGPAASVALGALLPVAAVVIWGRLLAPASDHRLADPGRFYVELALFAASALALAAAGPVGWAIAFAVVAVGAAVAVRLYAPGS